MKFAEWLCENNFIGTFAFGQSVRIAAVSAASYGLWHEKFGLRQARAKSRGRYSLESESLAWSAALAGKRAGDRGQLESFAERIEDLRKALGGDAFDAPIHSFSHFVTGVGIAHPVENGFAWHRTCGVPYLPGSGVKGATLAYASDWADDPAGNKQEAIERIFGLGQLEQRRFQVNAESPGGATPNPGTAGSVIFLDALPLEPPMLGAQVLTPHGEGSGAPDDAGKTNPIGFLAVTTGLFRFVVLPRRVPNVDLVTAQKDSRQAMQWLRCALSETGVGAKTKSGYGRFVPR